MVYNMFLIRVLFFSIFRYNGINTVTDFNILLMTTHNSIIHFIICSFIGKMATLINTIPGTVIGGISFLLYGMIGTSGIRILVDSRVDYGRSRNMAMTSVIFVVGLSGITVQFGSIQLTGLVLACVVGRIMGLTFCVLDKLKLTNDREEA